MQSIFLLLPAAAFSSALIFLENKKTKGPPESEDLRQVWLRASLWFAVYLVAVLEILSLFHGITRLMLGVAWLAPLLAFGYWVYRTKKKRRAIFLLSYKNPLHWREVPYFLTITTILSITLLVALLSPPQTWDTLSYHMSRIAHWAQNQSVGHYITGIERQNSMSPGAEEITLNSYVLTQSDRFATLTQWFAMLGSLIGVSLIAKRMGANSSGQWLAALFAATLPISLVEASSTITDYVATFWVVCVALESINYYRFGDHQSLVYVALSAGLVILSKPTVVPYLPVFAAWILILLLTRRGWGETLAWGGIAILIVLLINAGYISRNLITYKSLSNPADFKEHNNELRTLPGLISTVVKNAATQAGFPNSPELNDQISLLVFKIHVKLNVDWQDPRTTDIGPFVIRPPSTQEDRATNPYHAVLILIVFLLTILLYRKIGWIGFFYASLIAASFVLFSFFYKWNGFGNRYHLAFFVLFAPVFGLVFSNLKFDLIWGYSAVAFLLITSLPWLLSIDERPLIPTQYSTVGSILVEPYDKLYFANATPAEGMYRQMVSSIREAGCSNVGLMMNGEDPEYLFWELMDAPRQNLDIEWIVSGTPSSIYKNNSFQPCAIICANCTEKSIRQLDYAYSLNNFQLYLQPSGQNK